MKTLAHSAQTVIALHCSGGNGRNWETLARQFGGAFSVVAPSLLTTAEIDWSKANQFTYEAERNAILKIVDASSADIHLVGHSYGGSVALDVALARPNRIASLWLYEPAAFYLLPKPGSLRHDATRRIERLTELIEEALIAGRYEPAAAYFVDFWGGPGAWATSSDKAKARIIAQLPKLSLEFRAAMAHPADVNFDAITCPVQLCQGSHSPAVATLITYRLHELIPSSRHLEWDTLGHMAPLTHPEVVSSAIVSFVHGVRSCNGLLQAA